MLKEHNVCVLKDKNHKDDIKVEINFNKDLPDVVKMTMGKKTAVIDKKDLYTLIFVIANPDVQSDLLPVRQTQVTKYIRAITLKAKKNIPKGEFIRANIEINVPTIIEEGLVGFLKERKDRVNSKYVIVPK